MASDIVNLRPGTLMITEDEGQGKSFFLQYEGLVVPDGYLEPKWDAISAKCAWCEAVSNPLRWAWLSFTEQQRAILAANAKFVTDALDVDAIDQLERAPRIGHK